MKGRRTQAALRTVPVLMLVAGIVLTMHCPKPNLPPGVPDLPFGVTHDTIGTSYEFSSCAVDPEGGELSIRFDWGDGDTSGWSAFAPSGDTVTMSHSWTGPGEYPVRAQAQDRRGAESDWSEPHQVNIAGEPAIIEWRYETEGPVLFSPAVGPDGTVYAGAGANEPDHLYVINPDGTLKWKYRTGAWITTSPAIADDGTVYFGASNSLYALNPDGTLKWRYRTEGSSFFAPSIGADGTLYVTDWHNLYALNPDGTLKWRCNVPALSSAAIGADGTIYVSGRSSDGSRLSAISPNGMLKWQYAVKYLFMPTVDLYYSSPAIAADGTVYIGLEDGHLHALNPDGTLIWQHRLSSFWSSPAIAADGTIYIGAWAYGLYAIMGTSPLADSPWPKFQRDNQNTGRVRRP